MKAYKVSTELGRTNRKRVNNQQCLVEPLTPRF